MGFREFINKLNRNEELKTCKKPISKKLEIAALMKYSDGKPLLFENVKESEFRIAANIFSTKNLIAKYFGIKEEAIVPSMLKALKNRAKPEEIKKAECQQIVEKNVNLNKLPILFHFPKDGGNYITSGVIIANDNELGQNVSFHRCMQLSKNKFSVRILPRHLDEFIKRNNGELDVTLCVGCGANVLLAGATSVSLGINELEIANSLERLYVTKAKTVNILIPADCEFVLEGRIIKEQNTEGPFVDLTGTYDIVREQAVFEVKAITHRKEAIWHGLLPSGLEHKLLMGLPKEPVIFESVSKVCKCLDVSITPNGCNWLHVIVKIEKKSEQDIKKVIEAAFNAHKSLKHLFIVDKDINIRDFSQVEWCLATRFQADRDLYIIRDKGSSLDPSANQITGETAKAAFDLTIPLERNKDDFIRAETKKINHKRYFK